MAVRPAVREPVKLDKETRDALATSLARYVEEELEVTIGDLGAGLFLDYILEEIGPSIYNQAVQDARAFLADKLEDLEATCYQPELTYWERRHHR